MRRAARSPLRWLSRSPALRGVDRAVPGLARLALRPGEALLPASVRTFPAKVESVLGGPLGPPERRRLLEARVAFLLTRVLLNQALLARAPDDGPPRLAPIDVEGREHLAAALAGGRGVIIASGHFGLPGLIRLVLENLGARVVGVGNGPEQNVDVEVSGDVWLRARALQRLRAELAGNAACVVIADSAQGRYTHVPFLSGWKAIGLGAFGLARITGSPLVPAFAMRPPGSARFRVEVSPPLPAAPCPPGWPIPEPVVAFAFRYAALARRYPCHLYAYDPLFAP